MVDFYEQLQQGRYGSIELKRDVGPNLMRGLVISVLVHIVCIGIPWLVFLLQADNTPDRNIRVVPRADYTFRSEMEQAAPESREKKKESGLDGGESGGRGAAEETPAGRGLRRSYSRAERFAYLSPSSDDGSTFEVMDPHMRTARPGEVETPVASSTRSSRAAGRRGAGSNGRPSLGNDDAGAGGLDDFGEGAGIGTGIGGVDGPGAGIGAGIGSGRGRGSGRGSGTGGGSGDGDGGDGGGNGLLALAPAPAAPGATTAPKQEFDVVSIRPNRGAIITKADRSPIVDWIEHHRKSIPVTMQKPELLNQRSGDVVTWTEFDDEQGRHYTLYLLGRNSRPPQLNIFLISGGKGTLLQDEGAKGESEVYKYGTASGDPRNPTVQLEQLPPGRPEAKQMMAVFTAWWNHVKSTGT